MLNTEQTGWLQPAILTLQIICSSLIIGAVAAAIVLFSINTNRQFMSSLDMIPLLGIGMGFGCFAAAMIVPRQMLRAAAKSLAKSVKADGGNPSESTLKKFVEPLQQSTIVRYALFEGTIFANILFWFMDGSLYNLTVAGAGLALMILFFPFPNRTIQTVETMIDDAKHS